MVENMSLQLRAASGEQLGYQLNLQNSKVAIKI
jgi:hypothetical protein